MELNSHSFKDILNLVDDVSKIVVLSKDNYFDRFKSVIRYEGSSSVPSCFVGTEVACILVDKQYASSYSLELFSYLLTRRRGKYLTNFPDQIYIISDFNRDNNYTIYGEIKL